MQTCKEILENEDESAETKDTLNTKETLIDLFGLPKRIIADRGGAFTNKTFDEFCVANGIHKHITATAMPRQMVKWNVTIK